MIWDKEAFAHFISGLQSNPVIQLPFLLFLFSGYLNVVRASAAAFADSMARALRIAVLPLGLMLVFTGGFLSITTRQFEWITAMPGDFIQPHWSDDRYTVIDVDPGLDDRILDLEVENAGGLFKYEPKIAVQDSRSNKYLIGAFPPSKIGDSFLHVLNFGLAPSLSISEQGVVKAQEYVPLKILAPGSSDTFEIQPLPYNFLISMEPEKVYQKGKVKAAEFNMRDPLYRIRVLKGQEVIAEEVTKDKVQFSDVSLGIQKPVFWVQLEAVRDRGVYLIITGLFFVVFGIPLYFAELVMRIFHK